MHKKHFQLFADSIQAINNTNEAERIAHNAAKIFEADNSRFDSAKFFKACGLNFSGFINKKKQNENGQKPYSTGATVAIKLCAPNDRNGNPRRVYVVLDTFTGDIIDAIDEGYCGIGGLHKEYPDIPSPPEFYTTPAEYRSLLKIGKKIREKKQEKGCDDLSAELGRLI